MQAWQYSTTGQDIVAALELKNLDIRAKSSLRKDELLIEVISASINPVEYKIPEASGVMSSFLLSLPATPGLDFCGRVAAKHKDCSAFQEGQNVFGALSSAFIKAGTLARFVVVNSNQCVLLPPGVDPDQAAATGTAALTAYQSLFPNSTTQPGSHVLINGGSGGIGTFAIQMAKARNIHVTVTCSTPNIELCKAVGADEVIDYTKCDLISELTQRGQVFDSVLDNVGVPDNLYHKSHQFLKPSGTFVLVAANPNVSGMARIARLFMQPSLLGGGQRRLMWTMVETKQADLTQIAEWLADGSLRTIVDSTFEFEDVPKAFQKLKLGRTKGKIVIHVAKQP
ncbi:NAD(P)-binding protein [Aureobasidium pullulans EXF-150]|uniref:NAD(P)-binding protein n=1 Tax=Aureobasidium pullulans EXF-150 TaxID=1043002 RepID=A0A074XDS8_AURPU|nr:NAD(P)-binding protein [Aureobasidium pullulans EXF-150]KEQ83655.1 NAD(P)-binding protein [Aureobasidium pullulans EXF-150]THZ00793.1 NAD(P)-binding protein [Aureobasidium pullulans]